MTDPNMNSEFQDRFFQGINFPLNKALMCFSYNDSSLIDRILLDRLKKISIEAYTTDEKIIIVKDFIIKEISEMIGYENGSIIIENKDNPECFEKDGKQKPFSNNCSNVENHKCDKCISTDDLNKYKNIEFIIENYTIEAGVRELKRCIEKIFLRLNIAKIYKNGLFKDNINFSKKNPIIINRDTIIEYLDKPHLDVEKIHQNPMVGVINGLYATSVGRGGIVPIQIFKNEAGFDNKFVLKLTGSQKNVMKESIICALTAATHQLNPSIRQNMLNKFPHGFHIHTPDGATPKDGPSAGCAFTTAFVSRILGKQIRNDIAMTGEIDLTGRVTKIGGLLYKLNGAKKAGVTHVLCSIENKDDYDKIIEKNKDIICDTFQVSFVTNVREIFKQVIIDITDDDLI
jgi:ATP-dependent Lon protease